MNREILRLSLPNILSNITIPLLGMVDMALMGHSGLAKNMGGVALGGVIFSYIYWGFAFLRMSTVGITAQAFGGKNKKLITGTLWRGILISVTVGIFLIVFRNPIAHLSLKIIEGSTEVESLAELYFHTRIWAAPATITGYVLAGWFMGMQNPWPPTIMLIVANLVNIICSFIFVQYLHLNVAGVALGTVIAQYTSLFIGLFILIRYHKGYTKIPSLREILHLNDLRNFLSVNGNIFIRTLCVILVLSFIQSKSASSSDITLAVTAVMMQLLLFFSFFIDGFANAAEALTGRFIGEQNGDQLKIAINKILLWGTFIGLAFTGFYAIGGETLIKLITNIKEVWIQSREFHVWLLLIPLSSFMAFILDGVFIGATATSYMRNIMLFSTFVVFFPIYFFTRSMLNINSLWIGLLLFFFFRGILQLLFLRKAVFLKIIEPK